MKCTLSWSLRIKKENQSISNPTLMTSSVLMELNCTLSAGRSSVFMDRPSLQLCRHWMVASSSMRPGRTLRPARYPWKCPVKRPLPPVRAAVVKSLGYKDCMQESGSGWIIGWLRSGKKFEQVKDSRRHAPEEELWVMKPVSAQRERLENKIRREDGTVGKGCGQDAGTEFLFRVGFIMSN